MKKKKKTKKKSKARKKLKWKPTITTNELIEDMIEEEISK